MGGVDVGDGGQSYKYAFFISYTSSDKKKAKRLQRRLERFESRPFRPPKYRVFRDETDLASTGETLDDSLKAELVNSKHLVYLASTASQDSKYVALELDYWRNALNRKDRQTVVLTERNLADRFPDLNDVKLNVDLSKLQLGGVGRDAICRIIADSTKRDLRKLKRYELTRRIPRIAFGVVALIAAALLIRTTVTADRDRDQIAAQQELETEAQLVAQNAQSDPVNSLAQSIEIVTAGAGDEGYRTLAKSLQEFETRTSETVLLTELGDAHAIAVEGSTIAQWFTESSQQFGPATVVVRAVRDDGLDVIDQFSVSRSVHESSGAGHLAVHPEAGFLALTTWQQDTGVSYLTTFGYPDGKVVGQLQLPIRVGDIAFSASGEQLAISSISEPSVVVWGHVNGTQRSFQASDNNTIVDLQWSEDDAFLHRLTTWTGATGRIGDTSDFIIERWALSSPGDAAEQSIEVSYDGGTTASFASTEPSLLVLDNPRVNLEHQSFVAGEATTMWEQDFTAGEVWDLHYSDDGERVFAFLSNSSVIELDLASGEILREAGLGQLEVDPRLIAAEGMVEVSESRIMMIAATGRASIVYLADEPTLANEIQLSDHDPAPRPAFSADSTLLAGSSAPRMLDLWSIDEGSASLRGSLETDYEVQAVGVVSTGELMAVWNEYTSEAVTVVATSDGELRPSQVVHLPDRPMVAMPGRYDVNAVSNRALITGSPALAVSRSGEIEEFEDWIRDGTFDASGRWIMWKQFTDSAEVISVNEGMSTPREVLRFEGHSPIDEILPGTKVGHFALVEDRESVVVYDAESDTVLGDVRVDHILSAAIDPSGEVVATVGLEDSISFWHVESGELITKIPASFPTAHTIVMSPDGKWLATAGASGTFLHRNPLSVSYACERLATAELLDDAARIQSEHCDATEPPIEAAPAAAQEPTRWATDLSTDSFATPDSVGDSCDAYVCDIDYGAGRFFATDEREGWMFWPRRDASFVPYGSMLDAAGADVHIDGIGQLPGRLAFASTESLFVARMMGSDGADEVHLCDWATGTCMRSRGLDLEDPSLDSVEVDLVFHDVGAPSRFFSAYQRAVEASSTPMTLDRAGEVPIGILERGDNVLSLRSDGHPRGRIIVRTENGLPLAGYIDAAALEEFKGEEAEGSLVTLAVPNEVHQLLTVSSDGFTLADTPGSCVRDSLCGGLFGVAWGTPEVEALERLERELGDLYGWGFMLEFDDETTGLASVDFFEPLSAGRRAIFGLPEGLNVGSRLADVSIPLEAPYEWAGGILYCADWNDLRLCAVTWEQSDEGPDYIQTVTVGVPSASIIPVAPG